MSKASLVLGRIAALFSLFGLFGALVVIPCGVLAIIFGFRGISSQEKTSHKTAKTGIILGFVSFAVMALVGGLQFYVFREIAKRNDQSLKNFTQNSISVVGRAPQSKDEYQYLINKMADCQDLSGHPHAYSQSCLWGGINYTVWYEKAGANDKENGRICAQGPGDILDDARPQHGLIKSDYSLEFCVFSANNDLTELTKLAQALKDEASSYYPVEAPISWTKWGSNGVDIYGFTYEDIKKYYSEANQYYLKWQQENEYYKENLMIDKAKPHKLELLKSMSDILDCEITDANYQAFISGLKDDNLGSFASSRLIFCTDIN